MSRIFCLGLLSVLLALPTLVADPPDDAKNSKDAKSDSSVKKQPTLQEHKQKYVMVTQTSAKLSKYNPSQRELVVKVPGVEGSGRSARRVEIETTYSVAEDVILRSLIRPERIDDKGMRRPVPPDELRKLKGTDPKVPGYQIDADQLQSGQMIQFTVSRLKDASPAKQPRDKKDKAESDKQNIITMILITAEDRPPMGKAGSK